GLAIDIDQLDGIILVDAGRCRSFLRRGLTHTQRLLDDVAETPEPGGTDDSPIVVVRAAGGEAAMLGQLLPGGTVMKCLHDVWADFVRPVKDEWLVVDERPWKDVVRRLHRGDLQRSWRREHHLEVSLELLILIELESKIEAGPDP